MIIRGHGVLWDPKKNKAVARFVDGELDTDDPRVIELARLAGFDVPEDAPNEGGELTREELLELAEEAGIKVDGRWSDKRLREEIEAQ